MAEDISPLAQRLAEAHGVDLAKLKEKQLEGKITARSALDYLNAAENNAPENSIPKSNIPKSGISKNSASSESQVPTSLGAVTPTTELTVAAEPQPANSPEFTPDFAPADEEAAPKKESKQKKPAQKERKEQPEQKQPEQEKT